MTRSVITKMLQAGELNMMHTYNTIEKPSTAEYKDRGSRFIAYAFPIQTTNHFKKRLKELRDEHPKAAHHCFAYRLGITGSQFRSGDDGEPAGSAGRPILGQIDSKQLTDVAIVVVRYFGGTLLGVPGLINAYKTVSSFVLQLTPIVQKSVLVYYELEFDYTLMNEVMIILKKYRCEIVHTEAQLFCKMRVGIPVESLDSCLSKINEVHGTSVKRIDS